MPWRLRKQMRAAAPADTYQTRMLNILAITSPIFLIIAIGFAAVQLGAMAKADMRPLGRFVISFALPALIFKALALRSFPEIMNASYLIAYGLGSLAVFFLLLAIALMQGKGVAASAIHGLGASMSNSGFIGYPVAMLLLGPPAVIGLALNMMVENMLMIPLALGIAESGANGGESLRTILSHAAARLVKNPLIIAIFAGAAVSLSGLAMPAPVVKALDMLALASGAVALFVIGGTLAGIRLTGMLGDAGQIAVAKLLLHPAAVFAFLMLVPPMEPELRKAALIFASVPMVTIYPLLGQPYGQEEKCAAVLTLTTALSFLTMAAVLMLL